MDRLRFLHIPKTAGSTFTTCLDYQYSGKRSFVFKGAFVYDIERYNALPKRDRQSIVLFAGHAPIFTGVEEIDSAKTITFLRNPVSRVRSFLQHIYEGKSPEYLKDGPFDLDKFLESGAKDLFNLQTKMLINTGRFAASQLIDSMPKADARDLALNNLFHRILEFGLQDYFDESLVLFAKALNWSTPFYTSINQKDARRALEFKQHHIDRIAELNSIDIEVYNAAKEKFLVKLESADFERGKLEKLKRANSATSPYKYAWHVWYAFFRLKRRVRRYLGDTSD
ncbi:MAG: sulfotransferase family 2 domain-containing protein [Chloroflexi bacterium]|nr:sulfotransferase family 2 domain-containing protein [Chloroflexota bacterium]